MFFSLPCSCFIHKKVKTFWLPADKVMPPKFKNNSFITSNFREKICKVDPITLWYNNNNYCLQSRISCDTNIYMIDGSNENFWHADDQFWPNYRKGPPLQNCLHKFDVSRRNFLLFLTHCHPPQSFFYFALAVVWMLNGDRRAETKKLHSSKTCCLGFLGDEGLPMNHVILPWIVSNSW